VRIGVTHPGVAPRAHEKMVPRTRKVRATKARTHKSSSIRAGPTNVRYAPVATKVRIAAK
jgi:ribosomal protein S30